MMPFTRICNDPPIMLLTEADRKNTLPLSSQAETAVKNLIAFGETNAFGKADALQFKSKSHLHYDLKYDANGGCEAPAELHCAVPAGAKDTYSFTVAKSVPYRRGYHFLGWAVRPDAESAQYQPEGSICVNAPTVLYAVWEKSNGKIDADIKIKLLFNGVTPSALPDDFSLCGTAADAGTGETVWTGVLTKEEAVCNIYDNSLSWVIHTVLSENRTHLWSFAQNNNCVDGYELAVSSGPIYTSENFISGTRCITNTYIKEADNYIPFTDGISRFYEETLLKKSS